MTTITQQPEDRWQTIRDIWKQNQWLFGVVGFVFGILVGPLANLLETDLAGLLESFVPEAFGIVVTVLFIDRLYRARDARQRQAELKVRLIREMGSRVHDVAINASEKLRAHGWLEDGSLHGAVLERANLQNADLRDANLQSTDLETAKLEGADLRNARLQGADLISAKLEGADLRNANLQDVTLGNANLQGATLGDANLQGATLDYANLQGVGLKEANLQGALLESTKLEGADLTDANLQSAILWQTNLQGANLSNANLQGVALWEANLQGADLSGADLEDATFDDFTILPDSEMEREIKWTPDTDMTRYTNREHPDFWQFRIWARTDDPASE